ncbi:hypothetical protein [Clostridium sp. DJ247]|uniref:hypothetical protein n=1 Tax=Clostridium sp. DJ247 TaxID=2726188 RepID=UPI00162493D8|nr:hypothetical protein [Clostridium sp. DJ247]MBC2580150.1 hypothetical protein [Clostridium sp. DJ247]
MKKLIICVFVMCIMASFVGCAKKVDSQVNYENTLSQGNLESVKATMEDTPLSVSIESDVATYEKYTSSVRGITLTPKLQGSSNKEIVYHWTINSNTEMFDTKNGPQKEVTNSGESVLFVCVAEISYIKPNTLSKSINITLSVEEKNSKNVLAKTDLIIEDYSGTYKVKK